MFIIESLAGTGFSWERALSMASASKIAYEDGPVIENVLVNAWGYETARFLEAGETQCFVAVAAGHALVAFRGTTSLGDWLGNMDILRREEPYGTVHRGFRDGFRDVQGALEAALPADRPLWLTGHSLGGALASIAAAEWIDRFEVRSIYTFGQPRVGKDDFVATLRGAYDGRFHRFVNDDDVVTRIPPGFEHFGHLVHFDENGNLRRAAAEAAGIEAGPSALSAEDFEAMQAEIREVREAIDAHRSAGAAESAVAAEALDASVEGLIPGVKDHKIDGYIAHIRRQLREQPVTDLGTDPGPMFGAGEGGGLTATPGLASMKKVPVLLRLRGPDWEAPKGVRVSARFGNFATAECSAGGLIRLASDPNVLAVERSAQGGMVELDTSVPFVKGDVVHRPPIGERGEGALVGIIDTGIDVLHECFLDEVGASRIVAVWDQRGAAGPAPRDVDGAAFLADYGTLHTATDIAGFLANPASTPAALRDPDIHGTHVASIAAGRSVGALADGMAPGAGIVVVIPASHTEAGNPASIGYSKSHVDALAFLKAVAAGGNAVMGDAMPIAVNVSQGMNAGAHDGTSLLEAMFDSVSSGGRDPGFAIVKSAGNERGRGGHARIRAAAGGLVDIAWDSQGFRFQDYIEAWYSALDQLRFTLEDPAGHATPAVDEANPRIAATLGGNRCLLELVTLHPDNGDNQLRLQIMPQGEAIQEGRWRLRVEGVALGHQGIVDAWVERDRARAVNFDPDDENVTLSIPGTAHTVISVGASTSSLPFSLTASSSKGLTRDQRAKPDLVAPGAGIVAALANDDDHRATRSLEGTSMAAPHVTGAIALVMSGRAKAGKPQLNAQQLRKALILHAQARSGFHNELSGWGVLDAEAFYRRLV